MTLIMCTQATEQTSNTYTDEAVIQLSVTPSNNFPPTLPANNVGFILENSLTGTVVKNDSSLSGILRLLVTDNDIVSFLLVVQVCVHACVSVYECTCLSTCSYLLIMITVCVCAFEG